MPKFEFDKLEGMAGEGRLFPIYLIYGPELYLIRMLVEKIKEVYHAETEAETDRFSAKGLNAISVVDSLKTLPMWTRGKLVIIGEADKLSAKSKEIFIEYASSPSESAVLIFTSEKFDGRSKLYKAISKNGAVTQIATVYENKMPFWISRECKSKGYNISQEAAHFMTELVGTNLSTMSEAVEKIILYIGSKKKMIDLKDVETVLSDTSQKSIFDLVNAVGSKDISRAGDRLINLLRNNESPVVIVNMLARHWRILLKSKELLKRRGMDERTLAKELGVHPFFVKEYISQSKGFSAKSIVRGIKEIWKTDVAVKSSKLSRDTILHNLIINLVNS